ncbi:hypothetical protein [uncultured Desulfobacter sp.]|uniref:hypothetical protein n=1 Tax=uncultured Desulfobacter sp. TaxID=240139 RepID=UPI002AAC268D|nr:hypothetical protein [uncultured Desulfobacter sp.]
MKNKKLAAAMAAVHMYIKTQEEAAAVAMQNQAADAANKNACAGQINLWGLSGRQAIMNANAMIRQRMLK